MNISLSLPKELVEFLEAKVQSGEYASSSEVVSSALHLLETQDKIGELDIEYLRQAWKEGVESGDYKPFDLEEIQKEGRALLASGR